MGQLALTSALRFELEFTISKIKFLLNYKAINL